MLRRFFLNSILLLSIAGFILLGAWLHFILTPVVSEPAGLRYQLRPGTTLNVLSENLYQQGIIKHPLFFKILAHLYGKTNELKAGIYLIPHGTLPGKLLAQVSSGTGLLYHMFIIVPGWSFQQLKTTLDRDPHLTHSLQNVSEAEVMKRIGAPQLSAEGEFFPDTYYFIEGTSDFKLLNRAFKRMQMKFQEAWLKRDAHLQFKTPYEALIAASLVEKESYLSAERPVIAGVLINRLQKKMYLQFDPTVVYGVYYWQSMYPLLQLGFSGILRKQDLKIDTPYNTYLHKGLPPTPIAIPSLDALNAVLHPVWHQYLYFVANGGGGHQFSTNLIDHRLAVLMLRFHEQGFFNYLLIRSYILKQLSLRLSWREVFFATKQSTEKEQDEASSNVIR